MDAAREQPPTSLWKRVLRWIGEYETAMDIQPLDRLELRVARLERRLAALADAPNALASHNPREI